MPIANPFASQQGVGDLSSSVSDIFAGSRASMSAIATALGERTLIEDSEQHVEIGKSLAEDVRRHFGERSA